MDNSLFKQMLESLAVGDAFGMPTEFMTREEIVNQFGYVEEIIDSSKSKMHPELFTGQITDDTEQNVYLLKEYINSGEITVENSARSLLKWVKETDAIGRKYIGPSSMKALLAIEDNEDPYTAGLNGTTCGGIMRTPAAVLFDLTSDSDLLAKNIINACIPTHNTFDAIEPALVYGFALRKAIKSNSIEEILEHAIKGSEFLPETIRNKNCVAHASKRILSVFDKVDSIQNDDELLDLIYYEYGTSLATLDVFTAVFFIFFYCKGDVFKSIKLSASVGGDTDTIGALVAILSCAFNKGHNIDPNIMEYILSANKLDFSNI